MKAYGLAIWLEAMSEGGSSTGTGEFSDSQIAAWEASARRASVRTAFRDAGWLDIKASAVSEAFTATLYRPPKA